MSGRVLLLVDLSYQCYRASAAHPMLSCDGAFTGGLYGFFQTFAKAVRDTGATHVGVGQDRKPYVRSRDYPEYKQLRKKARDEDLVRRHQESMPMILDALAAIGISPWGVDGFEFDDVAAHAVLAGRHRYERIWAASNDSDLWQLFGVENFACFNSEVSDAWNGHRLRKELDLTPEQYALSTALMGTHNDIEGIRGVGVKTARRAARDDPALLRQLRDKHGDVIERNLGLIRLPHAEFPGSALPPLREADPRDLYRALGRWDIQVTDSMARAVEQLQRGYM